MYFTLTCRSHKNLTCKYRCCTNYSSARYGN